MKVTLCSFDVLLVRMRGGSIQLIRSQECTGVGRFRAHLARPFAPGEATQVVIARRQQSRRGDPVAHGFSFATGLLRRIAPPNDKVAAAVSLESIVTS
jgi:hypothetical protein